MNKKKILVILTGGTISMKNDAVNHKAVVDQDTTDLTTALQDALGAIEIDFIEQPLKPSPYITPNDMFNFAKLIEFQQSKHYDGYVLTHGTDTIEETAYFLDLYLAIHEPVVLTGSMRNRSELGYDGILNLASAILVAASEQSKDRGVLVVLNDEINSASEVTKTHTVALDTFKSMEFGPLGIVDQQDVLYYRESTKSKQDFSFSKLNDSVEIVKISAGTTSNIINFLVSEGVSGIIVEALGRGNVPPTVVPGIKNAIKNNIPVILTSRCFKGRVLDTYGYEGGGYHLKQLGVILGGNLSSQKARIKLMMLLSSKKDKKDYVYYF
ncbi:L-asparaginase,asparaginase/glutaminase family protein [Alteracholeplasma palmae J233]|uniref:L-asparaginase,asparaginase/glutaminase family protein n=1 Tax=Alteracholeplasma palmae (strain ATCC 49389 / J233) TaxID=1318466 RepID=U4KL39_ALTPJ|nr:asparaginase [Alteracholeplasma palmae]CCV64467.1 L-asparaginase,asparaginase/glutaminase family protein [Alteracholeplasma palmae J233]